MRFLLASWLVLCLVLASTVILDPLGAMTPDSANYCRVASSIADGNGPTVIVGAERLWYTTHPPAYPAAIALVSLCTGTSMFWAAKIVQMLCLLGILLALRKPLGDYFVLVPVLLVCDASWTLFLYSWSEPLFILCAIIVARALAALWEGPTWSSAVALAIASSVGVLTRYSGIAIPAVMAIALLTALWSKNSAWKHYGLALLVCGASGAVDLWMNVTHGMSATGMREPASESFTAILFQLAQALVRPLVFIPVPNGPWKTSLYALQAAFVVASLFIVFRTLKHRAPFSRSMGTPMVISFIGLGLAITAATVLPRFAIAMDTIGLRFVAPGFVVSTLGLMFWLKSMNARVPSISSMIMVTAVILACGTAVRSKSWLIPYSTIRTYMTTRDSLLAKYSGVADSSIVVFGNEQIRYLRPSIHTENPLTTPWSSGQESMPDFLRRMHTYKARGLYIDTVRDIETYHPSVRAYMDSLHHPSVIVRLW